MKKENNWNPEQSLEVDFQRFKFVVARRMPSIIGFAIISSVLATIVVFAMTPIYSASTLILIKSQQEKVIPIEEVYGVDTQNQQYYETQVAILNSRPLVESVIDELRMMNHPEFQGNGERAESQFNWRNWLPFELADRPVNTNTLLKEQAVAKYYENLEVQSVKNTQLIDISFESSDSALAAEAANSHANAYIQSMARARLSATDSAGAWMTERLSELKENMLVSERKLQEFREQEQLIDLDGLKFLPSREINDLSSRLVAVRAELSQARIAYNQIYSLPNILVEDLSGIPAILDDTGVQVLAEAEAMARQNVAELAKRYGPAHTKMISARAELTNAINNLQNQRRYVAESIRNEFEAARSEEAELVKELDRAKLTYQALGRKESDLLALQREADTRRELYNLFYTRMSETVATEDLESAPARVISPAVVPVRSTKPKKGLIIFITFTISLVAGIVAAFLREAVSNTIKTAVDVDLELGVPLFGMLPLLKRKKSLARVFFDDSESEFNEAIRTIRTSISLDSLDNPNRVILVSSSLPGEGKSTLALNLAFAFAKMEKVLLIDADMRRPSIASAFNFPPDMLGLAEIIRGEAKFSQCAVHLKKESVDVMSCGKIPDNPLEVLSDYKLKQLLQALRARYDRIIIDSPPILPVSDGLVLSTHADSVLLVVKSDSTTVPQVQNALGQLRRLNSNIAGVVLNQIDIKTLGYGEYNYSYRYGSHSELSSAKISKA